jgi:alpha-L-fucosidase 2
MTYTVAGGYGCLIQQTPGVVLLRKDYGWDVWVGAAPWIAQHFWNHYEYSGDIDFLKNRAYPFFREVAQFFEDYLIKDETGTYQIMPSQSPENQI